MRHLGPAPFSPVMHSLHYHLLDVFSSTPFGGNQLAVFTDAAAIPESLMPRITRELNLSETVFVLPPRRGGRARVRIFTPGMELPFAGHPTLGTACLLASLDAAAIAPHTAPYAATTIILEEEVGDVPVRVRLGGEHEAPWAQLTAQSPDIRATGLSAQALAQLLRIDAADIVAGDERVAGPAAVSSGVPFLFIPLPDVATLVRCQLNLDAWNAHVAGTWAPHAYVYTTTGGDVVQARMFAPAMGIVEDPATGAAAAALAALLASRGRSDGTHRWRVEQGAGIGRPSVLEIEADVAGGMVTASRVGGHSVIVGEGVLRLPRDFQA